MFPLKKTLIAFLVMAAFCFLLPASGMACRDPLAESRTFWDRLPEGAMDKAIVARVVVTATQFTDRNRRSKIRVTGPVKNTVLDQEFIVISEIHSCARDYDVNVGENYYIAGDFNDNGDFKGIWKGFAVLP